MIETLGDKFEMHSSVLERIKKEVGESKGTNPALAQFFGFMVVVNDTIPEGEVHIKDKKGNLLNVFKVPESKT